MAFQGLGGALGPRTQLLTILSRKGIVATPNRNAPKLASTLALANSGS